MDRHLVIIGLTTALSGILSGYFLLRLPQGLQYAPGLFFGSLTALVFVWLLSTRIFKALLWLIASLGSWYLAFHSMSFANAFGIDFSYALAGSLGALLLSVAYRFLIQKLSWPRIALIAVTGGLLGVLMQIILSYPGGSLSLTKICFSFVVWQIGVGLALTMRRARGDA